MPPTWIPLQAQTFQYLEACDVSTMSGDLQQTRSQAQSIEVIDHSKSVMASWTGFQGILLIPAKMPVVLGPIGYPREAR